MELGKDLPPLTLSNTSVSCLVTLIPVLVSMTSHGDIPSYEDETNKPAWWPSDIQWRNPMFYVQDADKKDDGLKVLRKLVYSCYSYHGLEGLCRLEETPVSDSESESGENMEIIQLAEEDEEPLEDSSAESEGPVFVCCFCLDQFNSHEQVSAHQSACSQRFSDISNSSRNVTLTGKSQSTSETKHIDTDECFKSFLAPTKCPSSLPDISSDLPIVINSSASASLLSSPPSKTSPDKNVTTSLPKTSASTNHLPRSSQIPAPVSSATTTSQRRPAAATTVPFVPTLKTRSQKKLDQIMEKHKSRRLMLQECDEMKEVPRTGAWWSRKKRKKCNSVDQLPDTSLSKNSFMLAVGLAQTADIVAMAERGPKHGQVNLECDISSVESPLNLTSATLSPKVSERPPSMSPRSTRSLMSQLSRDSDVNSRRKLSFCFVEDEWADKQAINEGRDPLQISLLTLEFSSPLGQRIKKYVRGEGHLNIIKDIESYCKTELDEDGYSKLRYRGCDFRITFRKKRRASHHVHTYKFNKFDRMEFKKLLKTGLSSNSRHLIKCLPLCRIVLNRLLKSEIKLWTQEKKITISEQIIFDDDICITQIDIPESRMTQGFAPDVQSQSQHPLYRQAPSFGPSSPLSAGRLNATSDSRSIFSPRMSASPPHVPNIFRSRTSHTSSPPRPGPLSRPHNVSSAWRPQQLPAKPRKVAREHPCIRVESCYSIRDSDPHHNAPDMSIQNVAHLSGDTNPHQKVPDMSIQNPTHLSGDSNPHHKVPDRSIQNPTHLSGDSNLHHKVPDMSIQNAAHLSGDTNPQLKTPSRSSHNPAHLSGDTNPHHKVPGRSIQNPAHLTGDSNPQHKVPDRSNQNPAHLSGDTNPQHKVPDRSNQNQAHLSGDTNPHHKVPDRSNQNQAHLSGHIYLSPSAYTFQDRSSIEPRINGDSNNASNRRKQQLTHVRNDDADGGAAHDLTTTNRNSTSIGHASSNPQRRGIVENHHNDTMQKNNAPASSASVGQALGPSMRRLTNFDYFSIRDGKMHPSYPQHSHAVVSQHRAYPPQAPPAHSHHHSTLTPSRQNSHHPAHHNHCPPSSSAASQPRHNHHHHHQQPSSISRPPGPVRPSAIVDVNPSGQVKPSAIVDVNPSQQHKSLSSNGTLEGSSLSRKHEIYRPQPLDKMSIKTSSLHQNRFSEDDDVMEIICIDDD